jgi:hypothetical protein
MKYINNYWRIGKDMYHLSHDSDKLFRLNRTAFIYIIQPERYYTAPQKITYIIHKSKYVYNQKKYKNIQDNFSSGVPFMNALRPCTNSLKSIVWFPSKSNASNNRSRKRYWAPADQQWTWSFSVYDFLCL